MNRRLSVAFFLASTVVVALWVPSTTASHPPQQSFIGLFFDDQDKPLQFLRPTAAASKTVSLCSNPTSNGTVGSAVRVCTPGSVDVTQLAAQAGNLNFSYSVQKTPNPFGAFSAASDLQATIWLATNATGTTSQVQLPLRGVKLLVMKGELTVATLMATAPVATSVEAPILDENGTPILTLTNQPKRILLTARNSDQAVFAAGDTFNLKLWVETVGVYGQPNVDVLLYYGSSQHASGVTFSINQPAGAMSLGNGILRLSLDDNSLSYVFPEGNNLRKRVVPMSLNATNAASNPWRTLEWGAVQMPVDVDLLSDAVLNVTALLNSTVVEPMPASPHPVVNSSAAALLTVKATLRTSDFVVNASSQLQNIDAYTMSSGTPGARKFIVIAFPTSGKRIRATDTIRLSFEVNSTLNLTFLYGASQKSPDAALPDILRDPAVSGLLVAAVGSGIPGDTGGGGGAGGGGGGGGGGGNNTTAASNTTATTATAPPTTGGTGPRATTARAAEDVLGTAKSVKNPPSAIPSLGAPFVLVGAVALALAVLQPRRRL